jgi:hypothetical protein
VGYAAYSSSIFCSLSVDRECIASRNSSCIPTSCACPPADPPSAWLEVIPRCVGRGRRRIPDRDGSVLVLTLVGASLSRAVRAFISAKICKADDNTSVFATSQLPPPHVPLPSTLPTPDPTPDPTPNPASGGGHERFGSAFGGAEPKPAKGFAKGAFANWCDDSNPCAPTRPCIRPPMELMSGAW